MDLAQHLHQTAAPQELHVHLAGDAQGGHGAEGAAGAVGFLRGEPVELPEEAARRLPIVEARLGIDHLHHAAEDQVDVGDGRVGTHDDRIGRELGHRTAAEHRDVGILRVGEEPSQAALPVHEKIVGGCRHEHVVLTEEGARADLFLRVGQGNRGVAEIDLLRGIPDEILGLPVDQTAADVDLLHRDGLEELLGAGVEQGLRDAVFGRVVGHHFFQHVEGADIGQVRVGLVAFLPETAEIEDARLHGVRGEEGHDLQAVHRVPRVEAQVVRLEILVEGGLVAARERHVFLHDAGAHRGRGVIGDAVVGAHEGGETREMVVVGVGVEYAGHLVDAHPQRGEGVLDARPRIDEVDPALKADDARHAGPRSVPSVALTDVHNGEVFPPQLVESQLVGRLVLLGIPRLRSTVTEEPP